MGLENVEKRLASVEAKLDRVATDIASLNATLDTIKPIATSVAKGIWAIVAGASGFALVVFGMWLKHHYNW